MNTIWFHLEPQSALEWPRMAIRVPGEFHEASSRGRLIDRAPRTPPDSTPGHIGSRDDFQEFGRPDTELPHKALRARLVHGPSLSCTSPGKAIAVLRASRAHPPARWHRFVSIERREPLQTALQGTSACAMFCRKIADLPRTYHTRPSVPG